jgi:hypothetical protein
MLGVSVGQALWNSSRRIGDLDLRAKRLHNEGFHNCIRNLTKEAFLVRWEGHVARVEEKRNACRILVGKPEGKRPLGKPRRRWVDNIKINLREIGWDGMDSIDRA